MASRKGAHGRGIRDRLSDFGDEVDGIGQKLSSKSERFSQRIEGNAESWSRSWARSPWSAALSFLLSLIFLSLSIPFLNWMFVKTGISAFAALSNFVHQNFAALVIISAVFTVLEFLAHSGRSGHRIFWPVSFALAWAVTAWAFSQLVLNGGVFDEFNGIRELALWAGANIPIVFALFLAIGYIGVFLGKFFGPGKYHKYEGGIVAKRELSVGRKGVDNDRIPAKRLYRSGREKILGGVCGGIAEYLGIDPTIVRLVWVLLSLAWGFGVLLYIIMWIIMPRNPRDKWN